MNPEIKILQPQDLAPFNELMKVFEKAFEMDHFEPPPQDHLQILLSNASFLAIVAQVQGHIIAGLTVYILDQYYTQKPLAYIYDLAVLGKYQRQGIGRQLIAFTKDYFRQRGFKEIFVQAEKADTGVISFIVPQSPSKKSR